MNQITVQKGDTLWSLAATHLGDPTKWPRLYDINRKAIEAEQLRFPLARAGKTGPDWIFPGSVLRVPDEPKRELGPPELPKEASP